MMETTGADILVHTLKSEEVDVIFGYPGANSLPIHDSLLKSQIRHYLVRHEQAAAHAADGYARATGKVGVCLATSGPGATNLVTGIATAYMDSTPLVVMTGQVTTSLLGSDAFQETDIIGITMPITKHSYLVSDPCDIGSILKEAFDIARSGRPGPVLVDLPRDIMAAKCDLSDTKTTPSRVKSQPREDRHDELLRKIASSLNRAERPVLLIGGGVKLAQACDGLARLIEKGSIPFVSTMMGIGSVTASNGFNLGFIGTHGNELANRIVHDSDFILTIGARFSDRSTSIVEEFAPLATIAQIDIDASSIGKVVKANISLVCDIREALAELIPLVEKKERREWLDRIKREKTARQNTAMDECGPVGPFIRDVQAALPEAATMVTDVGLNQIWALRSWQAKAPRSVITPGGLGTMGFSLPAAMGVQVGAPDRAVVVFSGDGGFFMNIQELVTVTCYQIPIKIVVFNNGHLGMIRQIQDLFYGSRFCDIELGTSKVDLVAIAKGFGIEADRVPVDDAGAGIQRMATSEGPFLLEVMVPPDNYVYPIIPPGKSNIDM
ncbi:MAG: biosynthetic-type acetolactate synthase large subunit, partial [Syntrophaceae bacterium]|nr:biosynthetic-type acetolactate synthase large subunit [Syntrophaceae bacterium]